MGWVDSVVSSIMDSLKNQFFFDVSEREDIIILTVNVGSEDHEVSLEFKEEYDRVSSRVLVVGSTDSDKKCICSVPDSTTMNDVGTEFNNGVLEVRVSKN